MKRATHQFACALTGVIFALNAHAAHAAQSMVPDTACATVRKAVAKRFGVPDSGPPGADWFCDVTPDRDSTLFLVALRTARPDPRTRTNLLGWFAVDRLSGKLFKWDEENAPHAGLRCRQRQILEPLNARPRRPFAAFSCIIAPPGSTHPGATTSHMGIVR